MLLRDHANATRIGGNSGRNAVDGLYSTLRVATVV
jgi:hypothetical protein